MRRNKVKLRHFIKLCLWLNVNNNILPELPQLLILLLSRIRSMRCVPVANIYFAQNHLHQAVRRNKVDTTCQQAVSVSLSAPAHSYQNSVQRFLLIS